MVNQRELLHSLQKLTIGSGIKVGGAQDDLHGDDGYGHASNCLVVADGVSGTKGCSGILAKALVKHVLVEMDKLSLLASHSPLKPADFEDAVYRAVDYAREETIDAGRLDSTLSVLFIDHDGGQIYTYTVGDSKCVIIRDNAVFFETNSIIYDFNVPAAISTMSKVNAQKHGQVLVTSYAKGDICLCFSDGVGDNLFIDEILSVLEESKGRSCRRISKNIVKKAYDVSRSKGVAHTPFSVGAVKAIDEYVASTEKGEAREALKARFSTLSARTSRAAFSKEKIVKKISYYNLGQLNAFANRHAGKRDDISLCTAIIQ